MEKKNDNKIVVIIMSIVILVLVAVIVYMFTNGNFNNVNKTNTNVENNETNKDDSNKENNNEEEKNESNTENNVANTETNEFKTVSLTDPLVEKLYGYVTANTGDNNVVDLFAKYGRVNDRDIPNDLKLLVALVVNKLGDEFKYLETRQGVWGQEKVYVLDGNVVINKINEIFNPDNGYTHINSSTYFPASAITNYICADLKYNFETNQYEMIEKPGCGGASAHAVKTKLVGAEKNNDTVILTQKIYVMSGGKTYKTLEMTDVISDNCELNCQNDSYFDQGATTKYTFKLGDNGNYYFESKITE